MTKFRWAVVVTAVLTTGCAHISSKPNERVTIHAFDWIEGCWVTNSNSTQEVWSIGADDLVFGYNTLKKDGAVQFFEQMRLQNTNGIWEFAAYPRGIGPTIFTLESQSDMSATFVNSETDYPQKITYSRDGELLAAEISLANGSNPNRWAFAKCDKD